MAASNTCPFSAEAFKMPSEPCPLPSLGSDEESFVVLGKSLSADIDDSHPGDDFEPVGASVVEEAKQLINKELSQMDYVSLIEPTQMQKKEDDVDKKSLPQMTSATLPSQINNISKSVMEESSVLPKMPQVEKGFETANTISIATFGNDLSSEEVQNKIAQIIEENIHLKDTILQNNMSMKSQYERIVAWQEDVQKVHQSHKEKIIEAKEFIESLKKENFNLNRDLAKLKEINGLQEQELVSLKDTLKEKERRSTERLVQSTDNNMKEFELDIVNKKLKEAEQAMRTTALENDSLKKEKDMLSGNISKMDELEKHIENLQKELDSSKLEVEQAKLELHQTKSAEAEKQKLLSDELSSVKAQLYCVTQQKMKGPSDEEYENLRQQLLSTQVSLTQVEHNRCAVYAQFEALNKEFIRLKGQVGETQKDEMFALQTQLEVYKADFEAEKNAKDTVRTEKEKLFEDLQNLQRRNQQLQEEIEVLRERDYVVYPPHRRERHASPASSASTNNQPLKCPKCNFGFNTLKALESHVFRCIELDDNLP